MDSLYLAHPYYRPPGRVINGVLYHYGIPGMEWGKRRFQNKDGTLTEAGKRRYAKIARATIRSDDGDVRELLKEGTAKAFTASDRVHLKGAYKKLVDSVGEADAAKSKINSLAEARTKSRYDAEVDAHPEKYKGPLKFKARDDLYDRINTECRKEIKSENPDLVHKIEVSKDASKAWSDACHRATEKLVGDYGNQRVRLFSKDTVDDVLSNTISKLAIEEWYD